MTTYGVWCVWAEVSGGVSSPREAWLKDDAGNVAKFTTHQAAEDEALRLTAAVSRHSRAPFRYTARATD